jgi:MtrB/PioB family decaheme-associated outer membrane protein
MLQEESFLPFTVNPVLDASITRGLPRRNLDGQINTTAANFRIDSRPLPRLRLNARFRYDDRDNDTPRNLYVYVPGDSQRQASTADSTARLNLPYSYRLREYSAEAAYEIFRRTELAFRYRRREIERSYSETRETDEDTYSARLHAQPLRWASLLVEGELGERTSSTYQGNLPFLEGHNPRYLDMLGPDELFENNPLLRKFYLTDRERNRVHGSLTLMPLPWLSFGVAADNVNDDYDDTEIGLLHARTTTYTFDLTLSPCERFTTHAFYTREEFRRRQRGHSFQGFAVAEQLADLTRRYRVVDHDDVDTFGWGFDLHFLDGRLSFEGDAVYSRAEGKVVVDLAPMSMLVPPGTPNAFPTIVQDLFGVSVAGRYRFTENLSLRVGYAFERLNVDDWSVDGILPASLPRVLTAGRTTPDYLVHVAALSVIYEFR